LVKPQSLSNSTLYSGCGRNDSSSSTSFIAFA